MNSALREMVREIVRSELAGMVRAELETMLEPSQPNLLGAQRQRLARNGNRQWSQRDQLNLLEDLAEGMDIDEAAEKYGRTRQAIADRLWHSKYGIIVDPSGRYSVPSVSDSRNRTVGIVAGGGQIQVDGDHGSALMCAAEVFDLFQSCKTLVAMSSPVQEMTAG